MFQKNNVKIIKDLLLTKPLPESHTDWELDFFDREGYQLNGIEKAYHAINEVNIHTEDRMARRVSDDALNVVLQHWFTQEKEHPNIFIDPFEGGDKLENPPYSLLLRKLIAINGDIHHEGRKFQEKILSVNVVEGEQGDRWRANLNVDKGWNTNDKHGISSNRSYSYK